MLTRSLVLTTLRQIPARRDRHRRFQVLDRGWQHTNVAALTFDYQHTRWLKTLQRMTNKVSEGRSRHWREAINRSMLTDASKRAKEAKLIQLDSAQQIR
jgi:hypothetical protein